MEQFTRGLRVFGCLAVQEYNVDALFQLISVGGIMIRIMGSNSEKVEVMEGVSMVKRVKGEIELRKALADVKFEALMKLGALWNCVDLMLFGVEAVCFIDNIPMDAMCVLACLRKKCSRICKFHRAYTVLARSKPGQASSVKMQRKWFYRLLQMFVQSTNSKGLARLNYLEREVLTKFLVEYEGLSDEDYEVRMMPDCDGFMRMFILSKKEGGQPRLVECGQFDDMGTSCDATCRFHNGSVEVKVKPAVDPLPVLRLVSGY
jgi:hypothetical protein